MSNLTEDQEKWVRKLAAEYFPEATDFEMSYFADGSLYLSGRFDWGDPRVPTTLRATLQARKGLHYIAADVQLKDLGKALAERREQWEQFLKAEAEERKALLELETARKQRGWFRRYVIGTITWFFYSREKAIERIEYYEAQRRGCRVSGYQLRALGAADINVHPNQPPQDKPEPTMSLRKWWRNIA